MSIAFWYSWAFSPESSADRWLTLATIIMTLVHLSFFFGHHAQSPGVPWICGDESGFPLLRSGAGSYQRYRYSLQGQAFSYLAHAYLKHWKSWFCPLRTPLLPGVMMQNKIYFFMCCSWWYKSLMKAVKLWNKKMHYYRVRQGRKNTDAELSNRGAMCRCRRTVPMKWDEALPHVACCIPTKTDSWIRFSPRLSQMIL